MLKLSNWHKSFGNHEVPTGDVLTIIGSSGSGKSTLLRSINFLEPANQGQIQIGDVSQDISTMKQEDILNLRRKTAMVFQNYALFSKKTALENGVTVEHGSPEQLFNHPENERTQAFIQGITR